MTTEQKIIKTKVGVLELAKQRRHPLAGAAGQCAAAVADRLHAGIGLRGDRLPAVLLHADRAAMRTVVLPQASRFAGRSPTVPQTGAARRQCRSGIIALVALQRGLGHDCAFPRIGEA